MDAVEGGETRAEAKEPAGVVEDVVEDVVGRAVAEVDKAHNPMVCTWLWAAAYYVHVLLFLTCVIYVQYTHIIICTESTGFIIAIGSDPDSYKGSQLSLPPADNQWYKGGSGEEDKGKDGTDGGVGGDGDQSLKTPPPLPPALLPSLPPADSQWYKLVSDYALQSSILKIHIYLHITLLYDCTKTILFYTCRFIVSSQQQE